MSRGDPYASERARLRDENRDLRERIDAIDKLNEQLAIENEALLDKPLSADELRQVRQTVARQRRLVRIGETVEACQVFPIRGVALPGRKAPIISAADLLYALRAAGDEVVAPGSRPLDAARVEGAVSPGTAPATTRGAT